MKSMVQAMAWEFFRHNPWIVLLILAISNALPMFVLSAIAGYQIDLNSAELNVLRVALIPFSAFLIGLAVNIGQGPISRLYLKPISNSTLVACFFFPSALLTGMGIFLSLSLWNVCFELSWPVSWPALFGVAFWSALWPTIRIQIASPVRILEVFVVTILMWFWFIGFRIQAGSNHLAFSYHHGFLDVMIAMVVVVAGYWLSVRRLASSRCGRNISWIVATWVAFSSAWDQRKTASPSQYKNAWRANLWYEFATRGLPYIIAVATALAFFSVFGVCSYIWGDVPSVELMQQWAEVLTFLFILQIATAGLWFGITPMFHLETVAETKDFELSELTQHSGSVSEFRSALPVSDYEWARSAMGSIALTLASILSLFVALAVVLVALGLELTNQQQAALAWLIAAGSLGSWSAMANATAFSYWGQPWLRIVGIGLLVAISVCLPYVSIAFVTMTAMLIVVALSLALWINAAKRNYVNRHKIVGCALIALMISSGLWMIRPAELPQWIDLMGLSLALVCVLPIAAFPMAISTARRC